MCYSEAGKKGERLEERLKETDIVQPLKEFVGFGTTLGYRQSVTKKREGETNKRKAATHMQVKPGKTQMHSQNASRKLK